MERTPPEETRIPLLRSSQLAISRILIGHLDYCLLCLWSNPVFDTGFPPALLSQSFQTIFLIGFFDVIEVLTGTAVDLTGLGNVLKKLGKL
jgi:hypothetical protein